MDQPCWPCRSAMVARVPPYSMCGCAPTHLLPHPDQTNSPKPNVPTPTTTPLHHPALALAATTRTPPHAALRGPVPSADSDQWRGRARGGVSSSSSWRSSPSQRRPDTTRPRPGRRRPSPRRPSTRRSRASRTGTTAATPPAPRSRRRCLSCRRT